MKKIIDMGVDNTIELINNKSNSDRYYRPQIEILDNDKMSDFLLFTDNLSEYSWVDGLGGTDSIRRYRIDKTLNDVIHNSHTSIACGIKVVKNPLMGLNKWDKWENGYIECFARMDGDENNMEWFVWQYIKMDKLKIILTEFKNYLYYL